MTTAHTPPPAPKKTKRTPWIIGVAAFLVIALGSGAWAVSNHNAKQLAEAQGAWAAATSTHTTLVQKSSQEISTAHTTLAESEGKVADDLVRVDLATAITSVESLVAVARPTPNTEKKSDLEDGSAQVEAVSEALVTESNNLLDAVTAVNDAQQAWELAQALEAHSDAKTNLTPAITTAEQTAKDLTGKVADNKTIEALNQAIKDAKASLNTAVDEANLEAITTGTAPLVTATESLTKSAKAVTDSNTAWAKAEEAKKAAPAKASATQQPAAGTQTAKPSPKKSTTTTQKATPKKAAPKAPAAKPKPAAPKPAPKPSAPSGGGWVKEETTGNTCLKFDSKGNSSYVPC